MVRALELRDVRPGVDTYTYIYIYTYIDMMPTYLHIHMSIFVRWCICMNVCKYHRAI